MPSDRRAQIANIITISYRKINRFAPVAYLYGGKRVYAPLICRSCICVLSNTLVILC